MQPPRASVRAPPLPGQTCLPAPVRSGAAGAGGGADLPGEHGTAPTTGRPAWLPPLCCGPQKEVTTEFPSRNSFPCCCAHEACSVVRSRTRWLFLGTGVLIWALEPQQSPPRPGDPRSALASPRPVRGASASRPAGLGGWKARRGLHFPGGEQFHRSPQGRGSSEYVCCQVPSAPGPSRPWPH